MVEIDLKQENEKLNARLAKAVQVFGEQKSTIERLTAERDEANAKVTNLNTVVKELEEKVKKADEQDETFFAQVQEIDTLKNNVTELEKTIALKEEANNAIQSKLDDTIAKATARIIDLKADLDAITTQLDETTAEHKRLLEGIKKLIES